MSAGRFPAYVVAPPSGDGPNPPAKTRAQVLPLGDLHYADFERLCLRVIERLGTVEEARLFGEPGQAQGGIDFYAHNLDGSLAVYQCRRVKQMGPAKIEQAVDDYLNGEWAGKSKCFAICTPVNLGSAKRAEMILKQRERLEAKGKKLGIFDRDRLSKELKAAPEIVDEFFDRIWVKLFNGEHAARRLDGRLDRASAHATRVDLAKFYAQVFEVHDAGLSLAPHWLETPKDLRELYVVPDLIEDVYVAGEPTREDSKGLIQGEVQFPGEEVRARNSRNRPQGARLHTRAESWISTQRWALISGEPGAGKSSLLRFLALDLLAEEPQLAVLAKEWGAPIPLWIPFGRWTEIIESGGERSIDYLLSTWLKDLDQGHLVDLYRRALRDGRAVLLVDGLDEWKTVNSARVALDQLAIFAAHEDIRVLTTTRPTAFQQLSPPSGWASSALASLNTGQQLEMIEKLVAWTGSDRKKTILLNGLVPQSFVKELARTGDLRELASVPLILVFLYWIRAQNARLPRDRFTAYEALVDLLLAAYPARRSAAASMVDGEPPLDVEDFRIALGALAYSIHKGGSGDIDNDEAVNILRAHLKSEDLGPGIEGSRALALARELLRDARERLGILSEVGSRRLAFLHRSVQEHLCAAHISRFSLPAQTEIVEKVGAEPQWEEVVLSLIYLTTRPVDVDVLIESLRIARRQPGPREGDPLFAEIGIGKFGSSARVARELVDESAGLCETFARPSVAEGIARRLLDGLGSSASDELIRKRLYGWMQPRPWSLQGLYSSMEGWPADDDTDRVLERAIFSEEARDAFSAAWTYAARRYAAGLDPGFLVEALERPLMPETRAAIIRAVSDRWIDNPVLTAQIAEARVSPSAELRYAAIWARVAREEASGDDLAEALELARRDSPLGFGVTEGIADLLIRGWPRNARLKEACLAGISKVDRPDAPSSEVALATAISAFPFDPDVARHCVIEIRNDERPFLPLIGGGGAWSAIAANFSDIPELVEVTDEWILKQSFNEPEVSYAALIGRTEIGKQRLLKDVEKGSFPFWAARGLLEGWGMSDPEVAQTLQSVTFGDNDQAASLGPYVPQIVSDPGRCAERLLELLADPSARRGDLVIRGLIELDDPAASEAAVHLALAREEGPPQPFGTLADLIAMAPKDPRVRKLAEASMYKRDAPWWVIAEHYGEDPELRQQLLTAAAPLNTALRSRCWERLTDIAHDDPIVTDLGAKYARESDGSLATLIAKAHADALGSVREEEVVDLAVSELKVGGPSWEAHSQAALGALIQINRIDEFEPLKRFNGDPLTVPLSDYLRQNVALASLVVDHWAHVVTVLGPEYPNRFLNIGDSPDQTFWDVVAVVADRSPLARQAVAEFIRTNQPEMTASFLTFLGRTYPRSVILKDTCLSVLEGGENRRAGAVVEAAELLAQSFSGDEELGLELLERFREAPAGGHLVALAEGWRGQLFEKAVEYSRCEDLRFPYDFIHRAQIAASDAPIAISAIEKLIAAGYEVPGWMWTVPTTPLLRRVGSDKAVSEHLVDRLSRASVSISEIATFARLLSATVGLGESTRSSLKAILAEDRGRQIAVDLVSSGQRPLAHSILDALEDASFR